MQKKQHRDKHHRKISLTQRHYDRDGRDRKNTNMLQHWVRSLVFLCLCFTSCGYHLGEIRPTPMRSVRKLAVSTFKNRTLEPRVEVLLADSLIHQLQLDGTYQIAGSDVADAILTCTLDKAHRRSIRSVVSNVLATSEFELILEASYRVQDRVTGAILMDGKVTGSTVFFPTGDLQTDEKQAISVASQRLAIQIAGRIAEGW